MERRQTQENPREKAVAQPSSRISRLAQPRKYSATPQPSNRNRSSSQENISHYNRQPRNRSRSANPNIPVGETPIRQPIARSLSSLFTPASTNKRTASTNRSVASVNRKSVLKKSDNEQTARILEVLRLHFVAFLLGGLQSMSAKQFIEIIRFFAQIITGGKVVVHENNVDDVKHFVDFMEYPHQMNKSWFKAPTVSISYDRNVEFLDWLCDFVEIDDGECITDDLEYKSTESYSLVDQQFVASFVGDLKNGFAIWSDETAEFDGWKLKWIREIIQNRTGLDDVDASTGRIEKEYAMLKTKEVPFGNESLLQTQQQKLDKLKEEVAKLQAVCHEKELDLRETSEELNGLTSTNKELINTLKQMKETIHNQPVSADDRQRLIADFNHKKHLLGEKQVFGNLLNSISDENQVKIARSKRQKTNQIFAINAVVQKLFQIGIKFGDLTIDQLSIKDNDTRTKIKAKMELITKVREIVNTRRAEIHASVKESQSQLASISKKLLAVENEVSALNKQMQSLQNRVQCAENEIVKTQYEADLQVKATEEIHNLELKIQSSQKRVESLKAENRSIYEGIQLKTDAMLQAKRERQARQEAAIAELEQLTEELKDAVNHLN